MPKLNEVVTSILADLTRAQNAANLMSRSLSDRYKHDARLRSFPVPNALIEEVGLDLRFATRGTAREEGPPARDVGIPPVEPPTSVFLAAGHRLARIALDEAAEQIRAAHGGEAADLRAWLETEQPQSAVGDAVGFALQRWYAARAAHVDPDDEDGEMLAVVQDAVSTTLLGDPDVRERLGGSAAPSALLEAVRGRFQGTLAAFLGQIRGVQLRASSLPDLEVVMDGEVLAGLPRDAVQSITLKLRMRNHRWVVLQNGHEAELVADA